MNSEIYLSSPNSHPLLRSAYIPTVSSLSIFNLPLLNLSLSLQSIFDLSIFSLSIDRLEFVFCSRYSCSVPGVVQKASLWMCALFIAFPLAPDLCLARTSSLSLHLYTCTYECASCRGRRSCNVNVVCLSFSQSATRRQGRGRDISLSPPIINPSSSYFCCYCFHSYWSCSSSCYRAVGVV